MKLLDQMTALFFYFLRNLHIVSQSDCINLQSHQWCTSVPFSPHRRQHMLFVDFLVIAILTGMRYIYSDPLPIFNQIVILVLLVSCMSSMFWILTLYQLYHLWMSSPIQSLVFSFCWWSPSLCKNFLVWCCYSCLFFLLFAFLEEKYPKRYR